MSNGNGWLFRDGNWKLVATVVGALVTAILGWADLKSDVADAMRVGVENRVRIDRIENSQRARTTRVYDVSARHERDIAVLKARLDGIMTTLSDIQHIVEELRDK